MKKSLVAVLVAAAGVSASTVIAMADGPSGDVFLEIVNGRVEVGRISEDGLEITRGERVFIATLGEDVPNVAAEPGFQSLAGAFDPNGFVAFNFRQATRVWNGTDFSTVGGTFTAEYATLSATTPGTDVLTFGMNLPVEADGEFHEHPTWTLGAPALDGVYLVELEFFANNATASDPVWILWSQNADEATKDAAYDWAESNIPAPGAAVLALMALGGAASRRRR
jgi:hypothetical protein